MLRGLQRRHLTSFTITLVLDPSKIAVEGLKPGGSGNVFTTPHGNLSPLQAQVDLALPSNRGLPSHLLEIDVGTLQKMRDRHS